MAAVELVEVEGQGAEGVEVVQVIIGSTLTPACPTCSRALSKNTWTRYMSGQLTWLGRCMKVGQDRDMVMDRTLPHIHINTHSHIHTGSHRLI